MARRILPILFARRNPTFVTRLGGFGLVALIAVPLLAQQAATGFPEDWTHHHVVFSDPGTFHDASSNGSFDTWYRVVSDPRFTFQRLRRGTAFAVAQPDGTQKKPRMPLPRPGPPSTTLDRDWSATLGNAGVAPGMYPAKWQFYTGVGGAPSCSDYAVFGVNKAGVSGSQPNLVGYQNLYVNSGGTGFCSGTAPTVLFSYYVGTGTVQTSPILGASVNQVAYVESITGNGTSTGSKFHVLKGAGTMTGGSNPNGTIAGPVAPSGNATDVPLTLSGYVSVTRSSPFYDYLHDVAYVGDDAGKLHKFTPVFNGTPAEVTSSGANIWPAALGSAVLTSPVYDSVTTKVFVADLTGHLYSVNSTTGSGTSGVITSAQLSTNAAAIEDGPIVDSSAGTVYVFVNGTSATNAQVMELPVGFLASATASQTATVGAGSTSIPFCAGTFDNTYYSSLNAAQPAGNLYVCGNTGGNPTLYQIPITYSSGAHFGTVGTGPALASGTVACSPLAEFLNGSTDWLFAAVPSASCGAGTGAGGCVMSFNVTSGAPTIGPWTPSAAFASNAQVVDTNGNLQKCTGGGCGQTGSTSGTAAPTTWSSSGTTTDGTNTNASAVGTVSGNSAIGNATVIIGGLTLTASAPVAEVATISVPSNTYCIAPGAGVTVGTGSTHVTTNGTAPSGGSISIGSNSSLTGFSVTVGGVTYTYESSLANSGCGTTLNCLLIAGSSYHDRSAEALYRAINNSGNCTDESENVACYKLVTGQGANAAATASHTAATTITSISTWNCAGTVASLWSTGGSGETVTAPTGGTAGSGSANIIMPGTMSAANLSSAINTAIAGSGATGFTKGYTSPTVTLTASTAGSTGIHDELYGTVTGVTVAVTTAGSDGSNTAPNFQYWSGATAVSAAQLAANIAGAITSGEQTTYGITLAYTGGNTYLTISGSGTNAGGPGNSVAVGGTLTGFAWTYNSSATTHLAGGNTALTWTYQAASNGQTTAAQPTGTSGIIIDNAGSGAEESSIYFGTLSGTGTTNSGVKMTQSGLK